MPSPKQKGKRPVATPPVTPSPAKPRYVNLLYFDFFNTDLKLFRGTKRVANASSVASDSDTYIVR
jgi:hypothetical protein